MNEKVEAFFIKAKKWPEELRQLRAIILECGLTEELKWWQPCYSFEGKNVVIIGELKNCCVLSFFKGALLKDSKNLLTRPGENTQAVRIIRFTGTKEIQQLKPILKKYISEAIQLERAGLKVEAKQEVNFPEELQNLLDSKPQLKAAFNKLTPGRQRGYLLYFLSAKQSATRTARIEKYIPHILAGKGIHEHE